MIHNIFSFDDYVFDKQSRTLKLKYSIDDAYHFEESYVFDFEYASYDPVALDIAIQHLFFVAGVSYYKTFLPQNISVKKGSIDKNLSMFLQNTYQRGLGELFFVNKLDPLTKIEFPVNAEDTPTRVASKNIGMLVGLGGGKDSLTSVEILRNDHDVTTWSLGHRSQFEPLVKKIGLPHFWVDRNIDKQVIEINSRDDSYNGHIPVSAIFATVGTVVGILAGKKDNIVSNESSANEPTLVHQGVEINHQYSKSSEFERDYQKILKANFGESQRYYSILRPFSELRIAELFSKVAFQKYKAVFSSCNRCFRSAESKLFWCGKCAKCAFVYLALTPFIDEAELMALFNGRNLLLDPTLEKTYKQLLGIEGDKPLDCVGEVKESRAAMKIAQAKYPELNKYIFEIPTEYNWRETSVHDIPKDIKVAMSTEAL